MQQFAKLVLLTLAACWTHVVLAQPNGGTVIGPNGADPVYYCIAGSGGGPAVLEFDSTGVSNCISFTYLVTDTNGVILGIPPADMVNFGPAGPGECWVWGLGYNGTLNAMVGDTATSAMLATGSFDLSDNFISVFRDSVDGGTVTDVAGNDTTYYCISGSGGTGTSVIDFASQNAFGTRFCYVVTDNNGTVLGIPTANTVDFGPAGPGECWVWGLAFTGNLTIQYGGNISAMALSDGCYDLSDNFVAVFRDSVDGGTVTDIAGNDTAFYCISGAGGTGSSVIEFASQNAAGGNFSYVVTDASGTILGIPPGNMVDFGPAGPGECWVWGLSYTGSLTAQLGDNASMVALSDGCYDLSDNFVVVFRDSVDGGTVTDLAGNDTAYYCISGAGGTGSSVIEFASQNASGTNFTYVVTDAAGTILGVPPANTVDFGPAGPGECWVWGLSYTGELTAQLGDNAAMVALSDGCYDLSDNFVVVFRDSVDGGTVTDLAGNDTAYYCISGMGGTGSSVIEFASQNASGTNFTYVVTDAA
ncbi:MAG: hypothetical protein AAFV07_08570, partial [Bacteroidota bacterium]